MKQLQLPLEFCLLKLSDDKRYTVLNEVSLTKNSLRAPLVARKELELFLPVATTPGRDSAYERGGDARRKFWIKPLKETDLGVAQAFFDT